MSKSIVINRVNDKELVLHYETLKKTFSSAVEHPIDHAPWREQFPYTPKASFKIVYSRDCIGIYYYVEEEFVAAKALRPNENVWEDSCVEFFVSLDNKKTYYNFEFNVLGTGLIGYGTEVKADRKRLSPAVIESIDVLTQLHKVDGKKIWEMYLLIPVKVISDESLVGKSIHGNFYKCGDALPLPHFMTWNPIEYPTPNFHKPEYFGQLLFER